LILALPGAVAQYANQAQEANAILMQINQASSDSQRDVAQLRIDKLEDRWRRQTTCGSFARESILRRNPGDPPTPSTDMHCTRSARKLPISAWQPSSSLIRNLSALNDPHGCISR